MTHLRKAMLEELQAPQLLSSYHTLLHSNRRGVTFGVYGFDRSSHCSITPFSRAPFILLQKPFRQGAGESIRLQLAGSRFMWHRI